MVDDSVSGLHGDGIEIVMVRRLETETCQVEGHNADDDISSDVPITDIF